MSQESFGSPSDLASSAMARSTTMMGSMVDIRSTLTDIHQVHINSISQSADSESLISSDDSSVTMWNIERAGSSANRDGEAIDCSNVYYKMIEKAPEKIFELNEVITHC